MFTLNVVSWIGSPEPVEYYRGIEKDFEWFGKYKGKVVGYENDGLGNDLYQIVYLDGDSEDLFLSEISKYVKPEDIFMFINKLYCYSIFFLKLMLIFYGIKSG